MSRFDRDCDRGGRRVARDRATRTFAKSMLRAPWAMTMFGVRQAARLLDSRGDWDEPAAEMDEVSHILERRLDDTSLSLYHTGRRMQEGMVDTLFGLFGRSRSATDPDAQAWRKVDQSWARLPPAKTPAEIEAEAQRMKRDRRE